MPKASKTTSPRVEDSPLVESFAQELGDFRVELATFRDDLDTEKFLKGLPDDSCQAQHWGYVVAGRITFRFADHDEVYLAGDAYYAPAGHRPLVEKGTEMVEFSRTDEFTATIEMVKANGAGVEH